MNSNHSIEISSDKEDTQSLSFFEYLVLFILILYVGRANTFFESSFINLNFISFIIPVLLSFIIAFRWRITIDQNFYLLLFGFGLYFIAVSVKYNEIQPHFFIEFLCRFFIVYTIIKVYKYDFFKIYELILYYLAIIGLFMWSIQIALGGDTLYYLINSIPGVETLSTVSGRGLNVILYSIQPSPSDVYYYLRFPRNCGFAWEPGAFSVYLCMAIYINLFITKSEKNNKRRIWVLLFALISTQSTTGYALFALIILFYFINRSSKYKVVILPFMVAGLIFLFSLPFMSAKIVDLWDNTQEIDQIVKRSIGKERNATPQRFTSFILAFRDFRNNPLLGLGGHSDRSWLHVVGARISTISGIGNLLADFGIVGFLFLIITSVRSSFFLSRYYNYKGKLLFFLIILLISISYTILFLPIVMCFWMFHLFESPKVEEN